MQKQNLAPLQPSDLHAGSKQGQARLNTKAWVERGTSRELLVHIWDLIDQVHMQSSQRSQSRKSLHIDYQSPYSSALNETDKKHSFELVLEAREEHQERCLAQQSPLSIGY